MEERSFSSKLRQRADWCRVLAQGPCSKRLAQELEAIARDYELAADKIAHQIEADAPRASRTQPVAVVRTFPISAPADAPKNKGQQQGEEAVAVGV